VALFECGHQAVQRAFAELFGLFGSHGVTSCASLWRKPPSGSGSLGLRRGLAVFLRTGELSDLDSANLGDRLLPAGLRGVLARGNLALDLQMRALGESGRVVGEPSPANDAMPG
jgi:hypothetical protein